MSCSQCQGIETVFNKKNAMKELAKYQRKGPSKTTSILIDSLKTEGIEGMTLLDIGGGVGTIQHELLKDGITNVINVEASSAYIEATKEEAERQGHADKISYHQGDFIDTASDISMTDVVTLDRVICCYHDMEKLVGSSIVLAKKFYGLVYPRDKWWVKIGHAVMNTFLRLKSSDFRIYIHSQKDVHAVLQSNDFEQSFYWKNWYWQIEVFKKVENSRKETL
ncbi:MAG: methyltransferase domain-containing protein [Candidatus Hodarchaeales archaeon]|jgi:magnesium-protoporphyrin O-methyltransferase